MDIGQIISGCFVSLIAVSIMIYVSFTAKGKGPIFSNTYLWLDKQKREKADKKAEYKLVTIIFGVLAGAFVFLAVYIFTAWKPAYIIMWILICFVIIYAIIDAVKTTIRKPQ